MMSMLHAEGTNKKRLSMPFHLNFPFSISKKNKTSRYYDVNFTASLFKRRPTLIDRRELPRELEKQVRWSSLLLAERIFVENQRALIRARILEARESALAAPEGPAELRARQIAEVAVAPASEGPEQAVAANRVSSSSDSLATHSAESFYTGPTSVQPSTKSVKPNEPVLAHVAKSTADIQTAPESSKEPAAKASPKKVYKSKFTELGTSDDDEYPAVIIDDNGIPRAMSEDEITHYNLKLQAAAIEKPLAGAYLSRRRHAHKPNQTKHKKASLWSWKSFLAKDNGKGKSKLSWKMPVFGFAKKKDAVAREQVQGFCPHH